MTKTLSLLVATLFFGATFSQAKYWQQEVNYTIKVRLDDKNHMLHAFESFEYINNSPNTLDKIYIHLWPNAYQDKGSALAKQIYELSNKDILHFGALEDRGFIDSLDFKINGTAAKWEFHPKHTDIAIVHLNQPLAPGQRMTVSTPFRVKIPSGKISRLGHIGDSYQITQWYPKPAVYDHKGWHPMPYLNQGEFYSEFGSFDVTIELPKNYVVGATGDLQTASEMAFLDSLAALNPLDQNAKFDAKSMGKTAFPESEKEFKTIRYIQSNVHDFAWFADKRYRVLKGEVELPHSKRKVTTWAMYVPQSERLWLNALEYLHDATYYYSLWNGDYPYNQVTAVDGTISAGGGMEYPNVTVIGNASSAVELELVIVHEVGHNWFYGILGTNERVHGWMDEGLNTLNEMRYFMTKYPENTGMNDMIPFINAINFEELSHHDMGDIMFRATQRFGADQPVETHSCAFHPANYGTVMYQKTGLIFHYLKAYLGEKVFDDCMQLYFETWKFKHPYPEDLRIIFEQKTGKDLSWFFDDLINTTNFIDYKLVKAKTNNQGSSAVVKNSGQVNGPIEVNVIKNNQVVETQWVEPAKRRTRIDLLTPNADEIVINDNKHIPELYRNNNRWQQKGLFGKVEPVKFEFLIGDNEPNRTNIFWTPVIAGNIHDKLMVGAAIHNNALPMNRFQYLVAPMFSFGRQNLSGVAELNYAFHPKSVFRISRFGLSAKTFKMHDYNLPGISRNDGSFYAITPYWSADLGKKGDAKKMSYNILVMGLMNFEQLYDLDLQHTGVMGQLSADYKKRDYQSSTKLRYELINSNVRNYGRLMLESTHNYRYLKNKMSRSVELRLFGAAFTHAPNIVLNPYVLSLNGTNGFQDLFFENYYFGRGATSGMFTNQRDDNHGAFKTGVGLTSDTWMATANLYAPLPLKRLGWIGAFADLGAFGTPVGTEMAVNLGLGLRISSVFGLYFPLYSTDNLMPISGNYGERIRFTLRMNPMHKLNLRKLIN
jgi:hypothetical protein